jgi:TonB family protein
MTRRTIDVRNIYLTCFAVAFAVESVARSSEEIVSVIMDEHQRISVNHVAVSRYPDLKSVFLTMPTPVYALELRRRHITGSGIFTLSVDEKGKVTDVTVRQSTGHRELDSQAIYGLRQWRARPGPRRQIDVPMTFFLPEKRGPSL